MHELFRRHHDWWLKHRSNDTPRHCLLGMLKAIRNFVDPLLKPPAIGVDNRPAAAEAIGDMLMYAWSLHHVQDKPLGSWPLYEQPNVDLVLGSLLIELGCQLKGYVSHSRCRSCSAPVRNSPMPNETLTHITGQTLHLPGRSIQRCGVCGSLLIDTKGQMAPLVDGKPQEPSFWPPGRQVRVTIGNPTKYELLDDVQSEEDPKAAKLAEDACVHTLDLMPLWTHIAVLAHTCCIPLEEAAAISIEKLPC